MLTAQEQARLDQLENKFVQKQPVQNAGLTPQEAERLAGLEQKFSNVQQMQPVSQMQPSEDANDIAYKDEADLGLWNRSKYALEPLESNRIALLQKEFGKENVAVNEQTGDIALKQGDEWRPVNEEGFSTADVADFLGSTPEIAGGLVGALLGGGIASIPTAIAGGMIGSGARQGLSALLGTPQVAEPMERAGEVALSGALETVFPLAKMASKPIKQGFKQGVKTIGNLLEETPIVGNVKRGLGDAGKYSIDTTKKIIKSLQDTVSPNVSPDAERLFDIARKNNIDVDILPESIEFGKSSSISRIGRATAENPLIGEEKLKNFYKSQAQVSNSIEDNVLSFSPNKISTREEAGEAIKVGFEKRTKQLFDDASTTFKQVIKDNPALDLSKSKRIVMNKKLQALRNEQQRVINLLGGVSDKATQAKKIINAIDKIKTNGTSYKKLVEQMQSIGEVAYEKTIVGRIPNDVKSLRKLYDIMNKSLVETTYEKVGKNAGERLTLTNNLITSYFRDTKPIRDQIIGEKLSPEKLLNSVTGDLNKTRSLIKSLPEAELNDVKSVFLNDLISRNAEGFVNYKTTINNLNKNKNLEVLNELFTPDEIMKVKDVLDLGVQMGEPVLSSSGTGASNALMKMVTDVKSQIGSTFLNESTLETMKKNARKKQLKDALAKTGKKIIAKKKKYTPSKEALETTGFSIGKILTDEKEREMARELRGIESKMNNMQIDNKNKKRK